MPFSRRASSCRLGNERLFRGPWAGPDVPVSRPWLQISHGQLKFYGEVLQDYGRYPNMGWGSHRETSLAYLGPHAVVPVSKTPGKRNLSRKIAWNWLYKASTTLCPPTLAHISMIFHPLSKPSGRGRGHPEERQNGFQGTGTGTDGWALPHLSPPIRGHIGCPEFSRHLSRNVYPRGPEALYNGLDAPEGCRQNVGKTALVIFDLIMPEVHGTHCLPGYGISCSRRSWLWRAGSFCDLWRDSRGSQEELRFS